MVGSTLELFTQSVAYKEIFGKGRLEGRQEGLAEVRAEGRQEGECDLALRQLRRRCGVLCPEQVGLCSRPAFGASGGAGAGAVGLEGPADLDGGLGTVG
ncbi:MAG: hypothetical protein VKM17_01790 [Cyanobacteriota bacterium]|nr:hypothetical protein [Cyanobacteriota bacterium]